MRGSSSEEGEESDGSSPYSLIRVFETECPYYMAMGMTYKEFWYEDPSLTKMYRKAYELKQQEWNTNAWVQGAYVYQAVLAIAPAMSGMGKAKPQPYLEKPIEITQTSNNTGESEEERTERLRYEKAQAKMQAFRERINAAKGGETDGSN